MMRDQKEGKGFRIPMYVRPPAQDEADARVREIRQRTGCDQMEARAALEIAEWDVDRAVENVQVAYSLAARPFTWGDARNVAAFVRDGLLMIVKGLERVFEIGKK